jgi:hypothetical protein
VPRRTRRASSTPSARRGAYLTNGTPHQSALATVHFLVYRQAQRLAVVTADAKPSVALGREVLGLAALCRRR